MLLVSKEVLFVGGLLGVFYCIFVFNSQKTHCCLLVLVMFGFGWPVG